MIKIIYTIFLGLLLALFVGTGISVFYTGPKMPEYPKSLGGSTPLVREGAPAPETPEQKQTREQYDRDYQSWQEKNKIYTRNVSIISLVSAVLLLTISLLAVHKIDVISDGLLLGGVLLVFYSLIRSFESDNSKYQFLVISVGLVIAIVLGYLKFIRPTAHKQN